MLALASGSRRFAFVGADNGFISRLVVHGERWTICGFNDTAHLDPAFSLSPLVLTHPGDRAGMMPLP